MQYNTNPVHVVAQPLLHKFIFLPFSLLLFAHISGLLEEKEFLHGHGHMVSNEHDGAHLKSSSFNENHSLSSDQST